eukprot:9205476-Pyramimonas_sp.AAC.1
MAVAGMLVRLKPGQAHLPHARLAQALRRRVGVLDHGRGRWRSGLQEGALAAGGDGPEVVPAALHRGPSRGELLRHRAVHDQLPGAALAEGDRRVVPHLVIVGARRAGVRRDAKGARGDVKGVRVLQAVAARGDGKGERSDAKGMRGDLSVKFRRPTPVTNVVNIQDEQGMRGDVKGVRALRTVAVGAGGLARGHDGKGGGGKGEGSKG